MSTPDQDWKIPMAFLVGGIVVMILLVFIPNTKMEMDGYKRGVLDCMNGKAEVFAKSDTVVTSDTIVTYKP